MPASLRPPRRLGPSLRRCHDPLDVSLSPSALSLALSSPWPQPPSARRRETVATVHPSPCRSIQKDRRRLLRRLHQSVRPREHHSDVSASSSTPGTRARLRSIRRRQDLPGLADLLFGIAVSPCSQPLSPLCRFPPLAPLATPTEARRRCASSPPWLEPTSAASESVTVLSTFAGAPSTPPLDLPCTTTPVPSATELRPPPAIVAAVVSGLLSPNRLLRWMRASASNP